MICIRGPEYNRYKRTAAILARNGGISLRRPVFQQIVWDRTDVKTMLQSLPQIDAAVIFTVR